MITSKSSSSINLFRSVSLSPVNVVSSPKEGLSREHSSKQSSSFNTLFSINLPFTNKGHSSYYILNYGKVYLNERSVLKTFRITNHSNFKLKFDLSSAPNILNSLSTGFQLENANISTDLISSTFADSSDDASYLLTSANFNELFNKVGLVETVTIEAMQHVDIIVPFLPHVLKKDEHLSEVSTYGSFSVCKFKLFIKGSIIDDSQDIVPVEGETWALSVIKASAQICGSILRTNLNDLEFADCIPGNSYVKEIAIWNRSEIELRFRTRIKAEKSKMDYSNSPLGSAGQITIKNYDTNEPLPLNGAVVPGYAHVRLSVTYTPDAVGEFSFLLSIENIADSRNVSKVGVQTIVVSEQHRDGIQISTEDGEVLTSSGGRYVSFDDCFTGELYCKTISVKNITMESLDIILGSDSPDEVTFCLHEDQFERSNRIAKWKEEEEEEEGYDEIDTTATTREDEKDFKKSNMLTPPKNMSSSSNNIDKIDVLQIKDVKPPYQLDGNNDFSSPKGSDATVSVSLSPASIIDLPENEDNPKLLKKEISANSPSEMSPFLTPLDNPDMAPIEERHVRRRVNEIYLAPGHEVKLLIRYCPQIDEEYAFDNKHASRLNRRTFRCFFRSVHDEENYTISRSIQARARVVTSTLSVEPILIDFGDCNVGTVRTATISITNHCDVTSLAQLIIESKALRIMNEGSNEFEIQPRRSYEIGIEFLPRSVNPHYRREIVLLNKNNRKNKIAIQVRASCMDRDRVTYQSKFYRVISSTEEQLQSINFEKVIINNNKAITFRLRSMMDIFLKLQLGTSLPGEIKLFRVSAAANNIALKDKKRSVRKPEKEYIIRNLEQSIVPSENIGDGGSTENLSNSRVSGGTVNEGSSAEAPAVLERVNDNNRRYSFGGSGPNITKGSMDINSPEFAVPDAVHRAFSRETFTSLSTPALLPDDKKDLDTPEDGAKKILNLFVSPPIKSNPSQIKMFTIPEFDLENIERVQSLNISTENNQFLEFIAAEFSKSLPSLSSITPDEEEVLVNMIKDRNMKLLEIINDIYMTEITYDSIISLPPRSDLTILAVFKADPSRPVSGKLRNISESLHIKLAEALEIDENINELPNRVIPIYAKVCRSVMNCPQRNINFGQIKAGVHRKSTITIGNESAVSLVYQISKSGSIDSSSIIIGQGRTGLIRPFGSKQVSIVYRPTMVGLLNESITISNLNDENDKSVIILKALVYRDDHFKINIGNVENELNFGSCISGDYVKDTQSFTIQNCSQKSRRFHVRNVPPILPICNPAIQFFSEKAHIAMSAEQKQKLEDQIEQKERKLRIAVRKEKHEKIIKLNADLSTLRAMLESSTGASMGGSAIYDDSNVNINKISLVLRPDETCSISALFVAEAKKHFNSPGVVRNNSYIGNGRIQVFEERNMDTVKEIPYSATIYMNQTALQKASGGTLTVSSANSTAHNSPRSHSESSTAPTSPMSFHSASSHSSPVEDGSESKVTSSSSFMSNLYRSSQRKIFNNSRRTKSNKEIIDYDIILSSFMNPLLEKNPIVIDVTKHVLPSGSIFSVKSKANAEFAVELKWEPLRYNNLLTGNMEQLNGRIMFDVITKSATAKDENFIKSKLSMFEKSARFKVAEEKDKVTIYLTSSITAFNISFHWVFSSEPKERDNLEYNDFILKNSMFNDYLIYSEDILEPFVLAGYIVSNSTQVNKPPIRLPVYLNLPAIPEKDKIIPITVDETKIILPTINIRSKFNYEFNVYNRSSDSVEIEISLDSIENKVEQEIFVKKSRLAIGPNSSAIVVFDFIPLAVRNTVHHLLVKFDSKLANHINIEIHTSCIRPTYIIFPELDSLQVGKPCTWKLGKCYIPCPPRDINSSEYNTWKDRGPDLVRKLSVKSVSSESILLSVKSNLRKQCYVYLDKELSIDVDGVLLKGGETIELYVALKPLLARDQYWSGAFRELTAGLVVQGLDASDPLNATNKLFQCSIKFEVIVGVSLLRVKPTFVNLGRVTAEPSFGECLTMITSSVEVESVSKEFPVDFEFHVPVANDYGPANALSLMQSRKNMDFAFSNNSASLVPGDKLKVNFFAKSFMYGLLQETFDVVNTSGGFIDQVVHVNVRIFVDEEVIKVDLPMIPVWGKNNQLGTARSYIFGNSISIEDVIGDSDSHKAAYETLSMDVVFVVPPETKNIVEDVGLTKKKSLKDESILIPALVSKEPENKLQCFDMYDNRTHFIKIENKSKEICQLWPLSDCSIVTEWQLSDNDVNIVSDSVLSEEVLVTIAKFSLRCVGKCIIMAPNTTTNISFKWAENSKTLPLSLQSIEAGLVVPFSGRFALIRKLLEKEVSLYDNLWSNFRITKIIALNCVYSMPLFKIKDPLVNLGRIALMEEWRHRPFSVTLTNLSSVNLVLSVELPSFITLSEPTVSTKIIDTTSSSNIYAITLTALETLTLNFLLVSLPQKESSNVNIELLIKNIANPSNNLTVLIKGVIIRQILSLSYYGNVAEIDKTVLCFPPVTIPPQGLRDVVSSSWFTIENIYEEKLNLKLLFNLKPAFSDILYVTCHDRVSNSVLESFQLVSKERLDIRVVVKAKETSFLSRDLIDMISGLLARKNSENTDGYIESEALEKGTNSKISASDDPRIRAKLEDAPLSLGSLIIQSKFDKDDSIFVSTVKLNGMIEQGRTFDISTGSLHFHVVPYENVSDDSSRPSSMKSFEGNSVKGSRPSIHKVISNGSTLLDENEDFGIPLSESDSKPIVPDVFCIAAPKEEHFVINNLNRGAPLHFMITSFASRQKGIQLVLPDIKNDAISGEFLQSDIIYPMVTPNSGIIPPGGSMKISVFLCTGNFNLLTKSYSVSMEGDEPNWIHEDIDDDDEPNTINGIKGTNMGSFTTPFVLIKDTLFSVPNNNSERRIDMVLQHRMIDISSLDTPILTEKAVSKLLNLAASEFPNDSDGKSTPRSLKQRSFVQLNYSSDDSDSRTNLAKDDLDVVGDSVMIKSQVPRLEMDNMIIGLEEINIKALDVVKAASIKSATPLPTNIVEEKRPFLVIHGATPLKNIRGETSNVRYTINVGQQLMRPKTVTWDFTILWDPETGLNSGELKYRMYILAATSDWVSLNSSSTGVLTRGGNNFKNVTLSFSIEVVGTFSSYLIIENLSNISDVKSVRLDMSVVTGENLVKSIDSVTSENGKFFSVKVESSFGFQKKVSSEKESSRSSVLSLDLGCCYFNRIYHNRKFVIVNHSSIVLDFILSSNASLSLVDLMFSKSSTSLKLITSVQVKPHSSLEVFLHYRAKPPAEGSSEDGVLSSESSSKIHSIIRTVEVYITCRIIRDYREVVRVQSTCLYPHMRATINGDTNENQNHLMFAAQTSEVNAISVLSNDMGLSDSTSSLPKVAAIANLDSLGEREIVVENLFDFPLWLAVRNNSVFFKADVKIFEGYFTNKELEFIPLKRLHASYIQSSSGSFLEAIIPPRKLLTISVTCNKEAFETHAEFIHTEKYVEEHLILYNRQELSERQIIGIRFTSDSNYVGTFHRTLDKNSYAALEEKLVLFISSFKQFWKMAVNSSSSSENIDHSFSSLSERSSLDGSPEMIEGSKRVSSEYLNVIKASMSLLSVPSHKEISEGRIGARYSLSAPSGVNNESGILPQMENIKNSMLFIEKQLNIYDSIFSKDISQLVNLYINLGFDTSGSNDIEGKRLRLILEDLDNYLRLYFDFHFLTDELVFYGTKDNSSNISKLAILMYTVVCEHECFIAHETSISASPPKILVQWIGQLAYFLSFFADENPMLDTIRHTLKKFRPKK